MHPLRVASVFVAAPANGQKVPVFFSGVVCVVPLQRQPGVCLDMLDMMYQRRPGPLALSFANLAVPMVVTQHLLRQMPPFWRDVKRVDISVGN